jgi:hypothetical protein
MKQRATYPKTYATIVGYVIHGYRVNHGHRVNGTFTPEEWRVVAYRPGKRRYYYENFTMTVRLENGEELVLDREQIAYNGKRDGSAKIGAKIKMYHHPRDTRQWRYKLLGE